LRGYPLKASGAVRMDGSDIELPNLEIRSGASRLHAQGRLGETLGLDWTLAAQDLAALWPGLAGALDAKGRISGPRLQPQVQAQIKGTRLAYGDTRIGRLATDLNLDLAPEGRVDLNLKADTLAAAGRQWTRLNLTAQGTRAAHRVTLALTGQGVPTGQLALKAGLAADATWQGTLNRLELAAPGLGTWGLQRPTAFALGAARQRLDELCLSTRSGGVSPPSLARSGGVSPPSLARGGGVSPPSLICTKFNGEADKGWSTRLTAPQLSFDLLRPWLPAGMDLEGHAELHAEAKADPHGRILGDARLTLPSGALRMEGVDLPQRVDFSGAVLEAHLGAQGGRAALKVPLAGLGALNADLSLAGLDPTRLNLAKQPLSGRIQAQFPDLGFISALTPHLAKVRGRLDLDYQLAGRLTAPRAQGRTVLEGGALDVPALGLALREIGLQVEAPDLDRLRYQGSVRSGKGVLRLSGTTRLDPAAGFPTDLKIEGDDWLAVDLPEAEVQVSPRLTLHHQGGRSDLGGEIRIPYGRIRPRTLPTSAVTNSGDLILVGGNRAPQKPATPLDLHAQVRILFGERVSFEGFGLRAHLSGDLLVIDEPGRPVIGRGRVGIRDGIYRAYGQDLQIQRGYALFADTPVDNPGLDVQAVRVVDTVTAGLRVTGTLKKPNLTLFSTPTLAQSDILSYILSGRPAGQGGAGRAGLTSALAAGGAGQVTDEIARQLGLDELRMETGGNLNEASVVAGTYLSPRLYVQYVNTLASRESSLRFRYDLTRKLQLQTETGNAQGVDLFYTIER